MIIPSKGKAYRIACVYDIHAPYHNDYAVEIACKIIADYDPDILVNGGDAVDMYTISRFDKDPSRLTGFQKELDSAFEVHSRINDASPRAARYFIPGNHEFRLTKYIRMHPELYGVKALQIENLLRLEELGYTRVDRLVLGKMQFVHGEVIRKHSAYTAKAHLENCGYSYSTFHGHSHRLGIHFKTTGDGIKMGVECGHLADAKQADYIETIVANWQQGICLTEVVNGKAYPELIPFRGHAGAMFARWRGKEYG